VVTLAVLALALTCGSGVAGAQRAGGAQKGAVERIKVRGMALEGNLSGDAPMREVTVYLPPGYSGEPNRRYPVLYMLHGYTDSDSQWMGLEKHWINLAEVIDKALAGGETREMIVVMPNAYTRFQGSMYSNSVTTGNWESFVADELVAYIDSHYRTIRQTASRGLAGHSMGGYGALRIGMKNPNVFSSLYLLNPCCLAPRRGGSGPAESTAQVEAVRSMEDFNKASFGVKATFASAAAWAPNPNNPPDYMDLPVVDGERQAHVDALFQANSPLVMVPQYIGYLRKYEAIAGDVGLGDGLASTNVELAGMLDAFGVAYRFETYDGNHTNRVAERFEDIVLPFFSDLLEFED
jgi:enterochelin esterase-like enzyme